ncbi:hypothetical protein OV079_38910 [Nannocystis pusilla]|uniref:Lipoprotein n=1 Tax=Nannocystis pusilla TaxID=889268 RepID=A0A9X3EW68_9BACT|nr:hypothetical protein [Nannocystis pusilla]MCY1011432.1 hypothetical protein [Nannocystis pusilla]
MNVRKYMSWRTWTVLAFMAGCEPERAASGPELPPLAWHGERVSVGTDLVPEVCAGTLEFLDRRVAWMEAELELAPRAETLSVWMLSRDLAAEACSAFMFRGGCANGSRVYLRGDSFRSAVRHELVHARQFQEDGSDKPLFGEGLAQAIGGGSLTQGCLSTPECMAVDLELLLAKTRSQALDRDGYDAGGDLVYGMLKAFGPSEVLALFAETTRDTAPDVVRARYRERFGSKLDDDFLRWRRGPLDRFEPMHLGCDAPPAPDGGTPGAALLQARMDCRSPRVVNDFAAADDPPREGEGAQEGFIEWTFEVTPEHAGAFELRREVRGRLSISLCQPDDFAWRWVDVHAPWRTDSTLPPRQEGPLMLGLGLYTIRWHHPLDPAADLDVVLAPVCGVAEQDCPEGQVCTIWRRCEAQVEDPAPLGAACEQALDGPRACEVGARCVGGVCTAECDDPTTCPEGQGCARLRVCGQDCALLEDDCAEGFTCLASAEPKLAAAGRGQCVKAEEGVWLDACDPWLGGCAEGLSCETTRVSDLPEGAPCREAAGCCVPRCDPGAAEPGCPGVVPQCDRIEGGVAGVCRTAT